MFKTSTNEWEWLLQSYSGSLLIKYRQKQFARGHQTVGSGEFRVPGPNH